MAKLLSHGVPVIVDKYFINSFALCLMLLSMNPEVSPALKQTQTK